MSVANLTLKNMLRSFNHITVLLSHDRERQNGTVQHPLFLIYTFKNYFKKHKLQKNKITFLPAPHSSTMTYHWLFPHCCCSVFAS